MLLRLPQVLDAAALARATALLQDAPWQDGRATAGAQARAVKNNQQLPGDHPASAELRALVLDGLQRHPLFFSAALPKKILPPRFNRYSGASNAYGAHIDNAILHDASGLRLRGDLSCTLFLSDPASYDGGELVIDHGFGQERVKLPAGDAVLYPASHVHRVEPLTRGQRLASFFWIESLVREPEQRRLLFELDMNLLELRRQHGESALATALTGHYHNLLRLWSQP